MVLPYRINMEIVDLLNRHGGQAVGLSGKDGGLMLTKPLTAKAWAESIEKDIDVEDRDGFRVCRRREVDRSQFTVEAPGRSLHSGHCTHRNGSGRQYL